jgi:carboxyl-terminal processing protease
LIQRDYSVISFYDYHLNRGEEEVKAQRGDAVRTDLGRAVYGGGGISPDLEVKSTETNSVRRRLFYGLFDFTRHLVNGQLPGFREYRIVEADYKAKLTPDDIDRYPVTDKLISSFRQRLSETPEYDVPDERFNASLDYVKLRLRTEIMTAAFGPELGQQVYLVEDVQLRKAVEKLPEARELAEQVSHLRSPNN